MRVANGQGVAEVVERGLNRNRNIAWQQCPFEKILDVSCGQYVLAPDRQYVAGAVGDNEDRCVLREIVGSSKLIDARLQGSPTASAKPRTSADFPMPGGPQMKTGSTGATLRRKGNSVLGVKG
jgi:hypothetical protein